MRKLKLEVEQLRVEAFATTPAEAPGRGTVAAAAVAGTDDTLKPDCDVSGLDTCGYTDCGDDTCGTCEYNSWCGYSCRLVCDADGVEAAAH